VAIILPPQPWTKQPQIPVGINRANPLTRGLIFCQVGDIPYDIVNGKFADSGSGTPGKTVGALGKAVDFNSTAHFYSGNSAADNATAYGMLVVAQVSSLGAYGGLLAHTSNLGTTQGWAAWQDTGGNAVFYGSAGTEVSTTKTTATVTNNIISHFGGGYENTNFCSYLNGVLTATFGTSSAAPQTGAGYIKVASSRDVAGLVGKFYLTCIWNRLPSAAEYASLYANCWQLFAPLPRRIFVGPSSGPASYTLTANAGAYTLSGQTADLTRSKLLTANAGAYTLSGQTADLTWAASSAYTLTANPGAYTLSGQTADLTWASPGAYVLTANAGAYTVSGQTASLLKGNLLTANAGAYTFAGQTADLTKSAAAAYTLTANPGAYTLAGQGAVLTNSGEVIPVVTQGPTFGISWGALVRKTWGKEWAEPEWDYQFSNGRRFKEKKNPYS